MATALEGLLKRLANERVAPLPEPAAPVGLGPLSTDTSAAFAAQNPEPVPPALLPQPAPDMNFVNQYAGPAPTAPTLNDPTTLDKVAAILGGIAFGPQYGTALREERDRPIREYQRQLEQFNQRRTQGLEVAERRAQRDQDRAQRAAENQYEREREVWLKKTGVRNDEAKAAMRQAYDLEKIREQERILDERQAAKERADTEKQRRTIESDLAAKDGAPQNIAKEISEYRVGLRPSLSTAAQKWQGARARKLEAQLARVGGGSGGGSGPVMAVLQGGQMVPASLVDKDAGGVMLNGALVPVVRYVGGRIPAQAQGQQPTDVKGVGPEGFPLALGQPGGPQPGQAAKPKLSKQQQARFNDIKRAQPSFSDEEILQYMQAKGWL